MDIIRRGIEIGYDIGKDFIFYSGENNPEIAHKKFIKYVNKIYAINLEELLFNNHSNNLKLPFELSLAAGFNKDGDISPSFIKYLGFDRMVVGTVTNKAWSGNALSPRMWRYPRTESMVNYIGLAGVGSKEVAKNLDKWGEIDLPLTLSIMSTPNAKDNEILLDLTKTLFDLKKYGDRIELNESCPNVNHSLDKFENDFAKRLKAVCDYSYGKEIYVKISPDLSSRQVSSTLDVISDYIPFGVMGIVGTNTTKYHDINLISPPVSVGGASGEALKDLSILMQEQFIFEINKRKLDLNYIACGGVNSAIDVKNRIKNGASGVQIFTPLIYKGPRLIREIREEFGFREFDINSSYDYK